jgi:hypothetical protein
LRETHAQRDIERDTHKQTNTHARVCVSACVRIRRIDREGVRKIEGAGREGAS